MINLQGNNGRHQRRCPNDYLKMRRFRIFEPRKDLQLMPGLVVHFGATVNCMHGGLAQPRTLSPRVLVSGQMS